MFGLQGWHLIIVVLVILLLFGATKLPALARGVGQSMKIFRNEIKTDDPSEDHTSDEVSAAEIPKTSANP